ncbi:hypothetical protein CVT24_011241 [Panaeolus cyanescens]|uniref:Uncharacterized protein n=1 Tax=Panaeolus cyanescens TaxID=181874 RepID=A0A409YGI4_9AGAR|nr:hypothetical protein CVT24_011241 [Panaeolus cyanescens]
MPPAEEYPTGSFEIYYFSVAAQSKKVTLRALGIGKDNNIVVLPVGTKAPKWKVDRFYNGLYSFTIGGLSATYRTTDNHIVVSNPADVGYTWTISHSDATSPSPVGNDAYRVYLNPPAASKAWTLPVKIKEVEDPVLFGKAADAGLFYFKRV